MMFLILNDHRKETEGIRMDLSLQHYFNFSSASFKLILNRETINMFLRKLSVSVKNRHPLENVVISLLYFQCFLGI